MFGDLIANRFRNPKRVLPYVKNMIYGFDTRQTNIYEREWDLLIVLDGCRVDTIEELSDEYNFIPETVPSIISVGGGSPEWLAKTFSREWLDDIRQTGYISANPHTRRVLSSQMEGLHASIGGSSERIADFDYFAPLWETSWDEKLGTVPAETVSDHLIDYLRSQHSQRIIAHYMQPHFPSVPDPIGNGMDIENNAHWRSKDVWTLIQQGGISKKRAYKSYKRNLRYVLDHVELVLRNTDAESVVITADHGNAFGEWGEYSHGQSYLKSVREVPWIETSAQDYYEYHPVSQDQDSSTSASIEEKLQSLGYKV